MNLRTLELESRKGAIVNPSPRPGAGTPRDSTLEKYLAVLSLGLQNTFVYRWNFLLRSLFSLVPLFGTVFVWRAIYGGTSGMIAATTSAR